MTETYNAVILGIPVGGSVQSNPSHAKAFGAHGSPIQFLHTPSFLDCDHGSSWYGKNKKNMYTDKQAVTKIAIHLKYDINTNAMICACCNF